MSQSYETPYKLGRPIQAPSGTPGAFDEWAVDAPFLFWHNGQFHLMYVGYDGRSYQTALAVSDDLIHWTHKGMILRRNDLGRWDSRGAAGSCMLRGSCDLDALPMLRRRDGRYWMIYHSYPDDGYERGPAHMGLAWCEDEDLLLWHRLPEPVFSWRGGQSWDRGGLYKGWLLEHEDCFYLFYNAKDRDEEGWIEQTGLATSHDLIHWQRSPLNPVMPVRPGHWDGAFVSDPIVLRDAGRWVMFYFGYDYANAQEGLAFSDDLTHWQREDQPILRHGAPGELDATHAHKPAVVRHGGRLYHIFCAVRPRLPGDKLPEAQREYRCLTIACSQPF